jgi:eukaryotic-like serine/threonine-protein kinase
MTDYEVFTAAASETDLAKQSAFLDQACAHDLQQRRRIEILLKAHEIAAGMIAEGPAFPEPSQDATTSRGNSDPVPPAIDSEAPGGRIGPYTLLQEIGRGGMGVVFVAKQDKPVRRQVALKVIKAGMDTAQVVARFEAERQALALMDHPHIAKVFDAGTTEKGRPYFVMELVKGTPLTDYCDEHRLDLSARLALFIKICAAVQHAHQKGIIHRDLKPSNILVESHDAQPVPKVIDFGLAKATSGLPLSDHTVHSTFGTVTGSLLYMAPEQATFNALDLDTRADIYALGVILYELLTGSTPIERNSLDRAAFDEMLRLIREDEPPTPSNRLSSSSSLPSIAARRNAEPARLRRSIHGELDWIVMKALAKQRDRRYATAVDLASDIERFTNHEPVSAGPPTAAYRFAKFVRRNRGAVIAASLILVALAGGAIATMFGLLVARQERKEAVTQRERAEKRLRQIEKANEILGSIFKDLNPSNAEREGKTVLELLAQRLDEATAKIDEESIGDPLAVARMQITLGESQRGLGHYQKAIDLFEKANATFTRLLGNEHRDTLASMTRVGSGYVYADKRDRGMSILEAALGLQKRVLGQDDPLTLSTTSLMALVDVAAGRADRGLPQLEEVLAIQTSKLGVDHDDLLSTRHELANAYRQVGKLDRAVALFEKTLQIEKAKLGPDHMHTLSTLRLLALSYQDAGEIRKAMPLFEEAFTRAKPKLGVDHPVTLSFMGSLADCYGKARDFDRALPLGEQVLALQRGSIGSDNIDTLLTMGSLAQSYFNAGKLDRAIELREEGHKLMMAKLGMDHPAALGNLTDMVQAYKAAGKLDRAAQVIDELAQFCSRNEAADSLRYASAISQLGRMLLDEKRWAEAERALRRGLAIREAKQPDLWPTFNVKSLLGAALLFQGKFAQAEPLVLAGYEGLKTRESALSGKTKPRLAEAAARIIQLYEAWGKKDKAESWRARLAKPETSKSSSTSSAVAPSRPQRPE